MTMTPLELAARLTSAAFDNRVGVIFASDSAVRDPSTVSAICGVTLVDAVELARSTISPGTRFLGLSSLRVQTLVDELSGRTFQTTTVLVANLDILLARLPATDRVGVWTYVRNGIRKRPTSLLILMPEACSSVFPLAEQSNWADDRRLATLSS